MSGALDVEDSHNFDMDFLELYDYPCGGVLTYAVRQYGPCRLILQSSGVVQWTPAALPTCETVGTRGRDLYVLNACPR